MAARTLLAVLLFIGAGLAGCISGDDPTEEDPQVNDSKGPTTEMPQGRDGKIIAFEETNATESGMGGVDHHHDYWAGRNRVVIFEERAAMEPSPDDQNRAFVNFRPPQGALIYEATASVEFTISDPERQACEPVVTFGGEFVCTPSAPDASGGPSGMKLRYKHSSTTNWIDVGDLVWGAPLVIKITDPRETDMPHATSSLWEFQVMSPNAHDVSLVFKAKAELVRGEGDVPLWPGHPNFYSDRHTREVLNTQAYAGDSGISNSASPFIHAEAGPVYAQKLISYGTKTLYVWVNITKYTPGDPATAPGTWFLYHMNATGRENITSPFDFENYPIEKRELFWILPVDENGMDSPYADGSRWHFELGAGFTAPENPLYQPSCYAGCASWAAEYTIVVHASDLEEPPEAYHMSCLRAEECPPSTEEA